MRSEAPRAEGTKWGEMPQRTFNETVKKFGKEHSRSLKPATRKRYTARIVNLLEDFNEVHLDEIGRPSSAISSSGAKRKA